MGSKFIELRRALEKGFDLSNASIGDADEQGPKLGHSLLNAGIDLVRMLDV
jgi:hypothetical protein